jgi:uncharacterized protein YjiS (DUF1127 family)
MTAHSFATFAVPGTLAGQAARPSPVLAAIRSLLTTVARRAAARRARRELYELPDFMLSDLGISRSEVASVVRHGWSDATRLARGKP